MSYRSELIQVAAVAVAMVECHDYGHTGTGNGGVDNVLVDVKLERVAQELKWGKRSAANGMDPRNALVILTEEVGEVARAILEGDGV